MKTLTVTFHHTTNYGAVLQAYALQYTIKKLGHDNDILEYAPSPESKKHFFSVKQLVRTLYLKYLSFKRRKKVSLLQQHFVDFHENYMQLTKPYHNMGELRSDLQMQKYDCLITGSDQVWNMSTTPSFIDSRLLLFGPESCKRFSYAASLEELNYTEEQKEYVKSALKNFNGISLREDSARLYIESFIGRKCDRVIDPVFLLTKDEWMKIAKVPRIKGPYILCYQVQRNKRMEEVAYKLKKESGYPVVSICNGAIRWIKSDYTFYDVSIEEFLGFYSQAAYVVSASFHGVAMGLVFEKPVYAMVKKSRADRLRSIMKIMGLKNYIVDQDNIDNIIEYDEAKLRQMLIIKAEERKKGLLFLEKMFS